MIREQGSFSSDDSHIVFSDSLAVGPKTFSKPVDIRPHSMDCSCDQCIADRTETWRLKGLFFAELADVVFGQGVNR
jgi:hypothetical protein